MKPTIGRRVYYKPTQDELEAEGWVNEYKDCKQPMDAGIIFVHDDETVNLLVTDWVGDQYYKELVQLTSTTFPSEGCWFWMPYQVKQMDDGK